MPKVVAPFVEARAEKPVIVRNDKDLQKLVGKMAALPSEPKAIAKQFKKISKIKLEPDEMLAMADSG